MTADRADYADLHLVMVNYSCETRPTYKTDIAVPTADPTLSTRLT